MKEFMMSDEEIKIQSDIPNWITYPKKRWFQKQSSYLKKKGEAFLNAYEKIYHNDVDKYLDVLIANFPEFIMRLPAEAPQPLKPGFWNGQNL